MTISHSLWSRIEHDRVYKPNKWERPEPEELERLSIIQQVVGLQENILKHDRQASDRKTAKDNQLFSNLGQVENYFSKWITKYAEEWIKDKPIGPFEPVDMYLATHRTRTRASLNELLQENFGTASEEEYLTIASEYAPVKLNLVIYLMDRLFLTTISEGGYEPDARIDSDEKDNVLRTKVIMSTMLWLNKLFTSTLAWQRKLIAPVDERPVRELDWLRSTGQYFLLKKPEWKKRDIKSVNDLWNWFENHNERPIKLAFYMSKRGLIRSGREEKEVMFNTIGTLTDALKIRT
ncbi:hypothetical protein BDV59DRAFT_174505 [Aspergillus ambiguus]|uniref:uncharacterized protein n=1 Tax=Aspergillus ambiguus TaxID=176160 RepID=UPI003CCD8F9A